MRIEVKVPQLPESVAEATLVSWHKKPGDAVRRDENLIDVETDKVVLELPSPGDGVLVELVRPDGSIVTSNEVIAVIDSDGKSPRPCLPPAGRSRRSPGAGGARGAGGGGSERHGAAGGAQDDGGSGVEPAAVDGTGRGGRITKGDVMAALEANR